MQNGKDKTEASEIAGQWELDICTMAAVERNISEIVSSLHVELFRVSQTFQTLFMKEPFVARQQKALQQGLIPYVNQVVESVFPLLKHHLRQNVAEQQRRKYIAELKKILDKQPLSENAWSTHSETLDGVILIGKDRNRLLLIDTILNDCITQSERTRLNGMSVGVNMKHPWEI